MIDNSSLLRLRMPTREQVEHYWLELSDATPLVVVRTFYGLVAFLWTATLVPDVRIIFFADGLGAGRTFERGTVITLFRWVESDTLFVATVGLLLASSALVVAGKLVRFSVPITAFLQISLIDASRQWGIGAERTMILGALFLAVFSALTPTSLQGHFRDSSGSRGVAPRWGLRLMQLQLAIGYLATSISKLAGGDWTDGTAVYHAIEADQLQRFVPPAWLSDNVWTIRTATYGTLTVELMLAPLLLWPKTRRWGVLLAMSLHFGFEIFLQLGFFALAMWVLILSFAPANDLRRILDWRRAEAQSEVAE